MNKLKLLALASLLMLSQACEKETTSPEPEENGIGRVTGCDYWPYNTGSEITFQQVSDSSQYTISCGSETTLDDYKWVQATSTLSASATAYYRCDGEFGYLRQPYPGTSSTITLRYAKINGAVDDTWTDIINVTGYPIHYERTITEIDGAYTILGVTYNDVMVIEVLTSVNYDGTLIPSSIHEEYISKQTGLIWSTVPGASIKIVSHNF